MKITVVGLGYVGAANAALLAANNEVTAIDINPARVDLLNRGESPIPDQALDATLKTEMRLVATADPSVAYRGAEIVMIATPTNFDTEKNALDTSSVDAVIGDVRHHAPHATIVIKSTVPIGYTQAKMAALGWDNILFSPEFLREGSAYQDSLNPSRIIVGGNLVAAQMVADLLAQGADGPAPVLLTTATEAETIKLFSNAYLAMRVAFFNEMDTFAMANELNAGVLIKGLGMDSRIGDHYNNPSFGFGGSCLPKDTQQLLASFNEVPQNMFGAIVAANKTRIATIAQAVVDTGAQVVGAYRLGAKSGSDNLTASAMAGVMAHLQNVGIEVQIYEPSLNGDTHLGAKVVADLAEFKANCDVILANRCEPALDDVAEKLFTRDVSGLN